MALLVNLVAFGALAIGLTGLVRVFLDAVMLGEFEDLTGL